MNIKNIIEAKVKEGFLKLYDIEISDVELQPTRKEFEGDITVVLFPLLKYKKSNPIQLGESLGKYLTQNTPNLTKYNVLKGFLNLTIADFYYINLFNKIYLDNNYGFISPKANSPAIVVEYSSPNTNKPLHLGHIRNNLLGHSVVEILKATGNKVFKTQIINDKGIHICKSMLAWLKFGNGATPKSVGMKGDKFVGNYYIKFNEEYNKQVSLLVSSGIIEKEAKKQAPILLEAQQMLLKWEKKDEETMSLWKTMNNWVYEGFDLTYKDLGIDFDNYYYESNTYLLGKEIVSEGLKKGVFYKKEDGSVWCDLSDEGLGEKIILRSDGTSVYITQDFGTAVQRAKDYKNIGGMVYTVGNEQDYHFQVLFSILKKLGYDWAKKLYHLSYGMVDLPAGKMKSREGIVIDADDLIKEMYETAKEISKELGKLDDYSENDKNELYKTIGLGSLKYFILKIDPKKRILFDPKKSIDFKGNTGSFIQYAYARIKSIIRKVEFDYTIPVSADLNKKEKELIKQLETYPEIIQHSAVNYSPSIIANFTHDLVKNFNSYYQSVPILKENDRNKKIFRVRLVNKIAETIKSALLLLGIKVLERM